MLAPGGEYSDDREDGRKYGRQSSGTSEHIVVIASSLNVPYVQELRTETREGFDNVANAVDVRLRM
jgi:hypothetical protein